MGVLRLFEPTCIQIHGFIDSILPSTRSDELAINTYQHVQ